MWRNLTKNTAQINKNAAKMNKTVNETKIENVLSAKKSENSANRISVFGHSELCDLKNDLLFFL